MSTQTTPASRKGWKITASHVSFPSKSTIVGSRSLARTINTSRRARGFKTTEPVSVQG